MKNFAVAAAIAALTALGWFQFPGHTWLQQDTQIYAPILEHLRDPSVLRRDLLVERPHVSFTLYDEAARALSRITGAGLREVLEGEQVVTRALGILGLYWMACALGLGAAESLLIAGAISLGASIAGPAVLSMELEPDPRGFAVPLIFLAVGLVARGRGLAAGIVAAVAFLIHAPTVLPFWAVFICLAVARRRYRALVPIIVAAIALAVAARFQEGASEAQQFFARVTPAVEALQRMRAPYSWISEWWRDWLGQYVVLWGLSLAAYWRVRARVPRELRWFLLGLPLVGVISVPASYLLLEKLKWSLLPQVQPMRALLFVMVMAQFAAGAAGIVAAQSRRYAEAFAWFALLYFVPLDPNLVWLPSWNRWVALAVLAVAACIAVRWGVAALAVVTAGAFFLIPMLGRVITHPDLHTPELAGLSAWARSSTARDAVFLFADPGKRLDPGVFRAEALRAVYVDWKGGGQMNYLPDLGLEWWRRWQLVRDGAGCEAPGVDYVVVSPSRGLADRAAVFGNEGYLVYQCQGDRLTPAKASAVGPTPSTLCETLRPRPCSEGRVHVQARHSVRACESPLTRMPRIGSQRICNPKIGGWGPGRV